MILEYAYPAGATLLAYLLGSLSFAVIVSKAMGLQDPRSFGSKNPGATNVLRSGSKAAAVTTLEQGRLAWRRGLATFYLVCSLGAVANVGIGSLVYARVAEWWLAGIAGAVVGSVLGVLTPGSDPRRYLVTPTGELAPLPPFAYALYLLGSGQGAGADLPVTPAQVGSLRNASSSIVPNQWPETVPTALGTDPCVSLTASYTKVPTVTLSTSTIRPPSDGTSVVVSAGAGALVRAIGSNIVNRGPVLAVDQTGSSYPVAPATDDVLARLGYAAEDVTPVPQAWLELFRSGPTLSTRAAQSAISQSR